MVNDLFGFYRALIVDHTDPLKKRRLKVWIPSIMPNIPSNNGIWANSGNNPIGGRNSDFDNDHHFMGTSFKHKKGAWVWVFFEGGNINRPFYGNAVDIENTEDLPECRLGNNPEDKYVIFKSHDGKCIVISDDPSDARVEVTGKKRTLSNPPTGDEASVYTIDGNQTTILLDQRDGKEKVLIRTHLGDFLHIDVDERQLQASFENDIILKTNGSFHLSANENIILKSGNATSINSLSGIDMKAAENLNMESGSASNIKAGSNVNIQSGGVLNFLAAANAYLTGTITHLAGTLIGMIPSGSASSASSAQSANVQEPTSPQGSRDT